MGRRHRRDDLVGAPGIDTTKKAVLSFVVEPSPAGSDTDGDGSLAIKDIVVAYKLA